MMRFLILEIKGVWFIKDQKILVELGHLVHLEKFYENDFVWLNHSISPSHIKESDFKTKVGIGKNSYHISVLNISGTSFGAISPPAITSLNKAAKMGGFAHNTGEGSLSPYHESGQKGDSIWQISTGYFGCRDKTGKFDPKKLLKKSEKRSSKND